MLVIIEDIIKKFFGIYKNKKMKILSLKYFDSIGFLILCLSKLLNFKDEIMQLWALRFGTC